MGISLAPESVEPLTAEEAETLCLVVRRVPTQSLRSADLVRLNHLRMIMAKGPYRFVPTALGLGWCNRNRETQNGSKEEVSKEEGRSKEGNEA